MSRLLRPAWAEIDLGSLKHNVGLVRRGIEHAVIDATGVRGVRVGSEAVLLGRQGDDEITGAELAGWLGLPVLEILPRLARTLPRIYLD